jgi:hypothetical protein
LHEHFNNTPTQVLGNFFSSFLLAGDETRLQNQTEPMTQDTVIIGIIAFALGSLPTIVIYVDTPLAGISCDVALVVIVYLALRLAPR